MSLLPSEESEQASPSILGNTIPRIFTPPLRELTPETSYGFAVIRFAKNVLEEPLDEWQEWAVIHAGELLPDGRPRFRRVLILVARQNGKTHLCKVLALYWLFVESVKLVLGTSTKLEYAKESWSKAVETAQSVPVLAQSLGRSAVLRGNNDVHMKTISGCKYKISASNINAGRSLSIDRAISDELWSQETWDAYNATYNAMTARKYAQYVGITNAGNDKSEVLNSMRAAALKFIETGKGDRRLGIFEWSAWEGCDLEDPEGWKAANPNLGRRIEVEDIAGPAATAKENGGKEEAGFRTEALCQWVKSLDAGVDPAKWGQSKSKGTLDAAKGRLTLCLDISPDGQHASLCAAGQIRPGIYRVEIVEEWSGIGCTQKLKNELPAWIKKLKPRSIGWFPNGPAASLAADLSKEKRPGWPPAGVDIVDIKVAMASVCMGFGEQVQTGHIEHGDQALLNMHVLSAEKLHTGDRWVFSRKGKGHCDAAYAAAGAVHLARILKPAPLKKVITSD